MITPADTLDTPSGPDPGITTTTKAVETKRDLLDDLIRVWGNSAGLDPDTAAAIILTVAGGIAGNSVRINAPMVGELGPDLQIAVIRDPAPALSRALQRLLAHFEGSIMEKLQEYDHLSTPRAQRAELSALEARLNLLLTRSVELQKVTADDNAMMNLALKCQEAQVLAEYEEVKKQVVSVRSKIRALRFRMRPMVMVSQLGIAEIENIVPHAYDSAVLEVVSTPGHLGRLALLKERSLERLAAFRRSSGCSSRLEFCNGEYRPRSSVTTLLLASGDEIIEASTDRLLRATGIIDEMLVCKPAPYEFDPTPFPDPGDLWAEKVDRLFSHRLDLNHQLYSLDDEARAAFLSVRKDMLARGNTFGGFISLIWRESGPALMARLALCARLFRNEAGTKINVRDVNTAARVALHLLNSTTSHWRRIYGSISKRGFSAAHRSQAEVKSKQDPVAKMVGKLKRLGPCTMRTLFRNYTAQNYAVLQPILQRAIEIGLVHCDGKLLRVASAGAKTVGAVAALCL